MEMYDTTNTKGPSSIGNRNSSNRNSYGNGGRFAQEGCVVPRSMDPEKLEALCEKSLKQTESVLQVMGKDNFNMCEGLITVFMRQ